MIAFGSSTFIYSAAINNPISNNSELVTPAIDGVTDLLITYLSKGLSFIIDESTDQFSPVPKTDLFFEQTSTGSADNNFFDFFYYLGYFLTFTVFAISMFTVALSGFFDNKNRVVELLVRLPVACVLIVLSRDILSVIDSAFQTVWDQIKAVKDYQPGGNDLDLLTNTFIGTVTKDFIPGVRLIILVLMIAFIIEFIKFLLEIMERFIVVKILFLTAPTANGLVVSRTTSSIMLNFYRMYFSQLLLLLFNRFFSFLLCAMIATTLVVDTFNIISWLFLIATCKAAQRIDSYMKAMGLTVAQTGSALLDSIMGAVNTIGKGYSFAKERAGFVGAKQMAEGVATGNYGLYKAGASKKDFSKDGFAANVAPKSEAATLKSFADAGGGINTKTVGTGKDKEALKKAMIDSYNRGNYATLTSFDTSAQTEAARKILAGPGEEDAFRKATGFNSEDIDSAHFDSNGNIEGTIKTGKGKGQISTFKVSSNELKGRAGTITTSDDQVRNIQTSGDISRMPACGSYEHSEGGKSNLSTMSGLDLDDERLSELGASTYMIDRDDNTLYVGDKEGNVVYARGLETGNEMFSGFEKPYTDKDGNTITTTPDISENDFSFNQKFEEYAPNGVNRILPREDRNTVQVYTNPKTPGGSGDSIWISGTRGKIETISNDSDNPLYKYSTKSKLNLNDKNMKLIDNREKGTYAIYGRDEHRRKIKV